MARVDLSEYKGQNRHFINPYNFVPVNFQKEPEREPVSKGTHTGRLDCELLTRTPLAIPDTANVILNSRNNSHKEYPFMRAADGRMMIPGSALRGPLRSMYEALTGSCLLTADTEETITYRAKKPFLPGLICKEEDGTWKLYKAKRYIFAVDGKGYKPFTMEKNLKHISVDALSSYHYGQTLYITPVYNADGRTEKTYKKGPYDVGTYIGEMDTARTPGSQEGYLCVGEPFSRKHFENVFVKGSEVSIGNRQAVLKESVNKLEEIIRLYNDETVNINAKAGKKFYKNRTGRYKNAEPGEFLPIWYRIDRTENGNDIKNIYLSVADIGRSAYNNTIGDMAGKHHPCMDREHACPACRMFGMTGTTSMGARVRLTDAFTQQPVMQTDRIPLKELAGPKPSYMPFYLSNKGKDWSYDSNSVTLRGRKFYWHNTEKESYRETLEKSMHGDRNQSMELVGTDGEQRFVFSVFYENLTDRELDELLWTLTLGENHADSKYCHKIGHGKPIGLGSAKIVICSRTERIFDEEGYHVKTLGQEEVSQGSSESFDKDALKAVQMITRLDAATFPVAYPGVVNTQGVRYGNDGSNDHASHKWFSDNYTLGKDPKKVLPEITRINDESGALTWLTDGGADTADATSVAKGGFGAPKKPGGAPGKKPGAEEKTVVLTRINPDKKDASKMVGFYNGGMVFSIPGTENLRAGDEVVMRVTNREKGFGNFLQKL